MRRPEVGACLSPKFLAKTLQFQRPSQNQSYTSKLVRYCLHLLKGGDGAPSRSARRCGLSAMRWMSARGASWVTSECAQERACKLSNRPHEQEQQRRRQAAGIALKASRAWRSSSLSPCRSPPHWCAVNHAPTIVHIRSRQARKLPTSYAPYRTDGQTFKHSRGGWRRGGCSSYRWCDHWVIGAVARLRRISAFA